MKRTLLIGCLGFLVGCLISVAIVVIAKYPTQKQEYNTYIIDEVVSAPRIIEVHRK